MNKLVKYHNDFSNQIILKKFTANELNFLMIICSEMKNRNIPEQEFSFAELKELTNWTSHDNMNFAKSLENMNKKLTSLNFEIGNEEGGIIQFVLFPTFNILPKSKILKVAVNEKFAYLLNGLSSNFTRFDLENFTTLRSKYSKMLYKELMKFKSTGSMIISAKEFREKLDIPEWYRFSEINKKVLTPAEKELSKVFQKFKINKIKRGREITKIEFSFTPQKEKEKEQAEDFMKHLLGEKKEEEEKKTEEKIILITEAEAEEFYQEYLQEYGVEDSQIQRRLFVSKFMKANKLQIEK